VATQLTCLSRSYAEAGYAVAKDVFTTSALEALRQSFRSVLSKSLTDPTTQNLTLDELVLTCEKQDHNLVYESAQSVGSSAATYQLLGSSFIFDLVSEITGFRKTELHVLPMYFVIQLPSDERFDYAWHQDGSYYPWCNEFLTLWFPVNRKAAQQSGTISVIPGSHQSGLRRTNVFLRNGFFKQMQAELENGEEGAEQALEIELGNCCIMDGNTVHRSVANHSSSPRIAGLLRIANVGAQQSYERERFYCAHKS
jgi:ectoine hydroxylase-related dioxygenase (phytanoyl-CoA dioxygenase family)